MKRKYIGMYIAVVALIITLILSGISVYNKNLKIMENKKIETEKKEELLKKEQKKNEIESHYGKNVITNKESDLFEKTGEKYNKIGSVSKDFSLTLEDTDISFDTEYFRISGFNYYIRYSDVDVGKEYIKNNRYKKYVVFNENVITNDETIFFRDDNSFIKINKSFDLPIYIKDDNKYFVEYNGELFYVNKNFVKQVKKKNNTKSKIKNKIRTLTYHTIYNTKTEKCSNTVICHPIEQFESHMKYLSENNYLTLTMNELEMFLDKKIQIPEKTIVITLDDGKYAINAVNIVEKYKVNATYFIITGKYKIPEVETKYMNFQSHTNNLHNNWKCQGGNQGGQLLCEKEEIILSDLETSKKIIGKNVFAFAYPFFDYNERAIKLLKKSGFRLAFVGQADTDGFSTYNTDRFKLRRKTIFSNDSLDIFISRLM